MTRIRGIRNNFSGGIISKEVYGNVDIEQFNNSLEVCENMIKQATGGLAKRTGTLYLANFNDLDSDNYKLIPYPLSDTVAFVVRLEAGTPTEEENLIDPNSSDMKEKYPKGEGETEASWEERLEKEAKELSTKTTILTTNVNLYLMDDTTTVVSSENVQTVSITYNYYESAPTVLIDYTKVTYVQNRAVLLVFIRDSILKITIDPPNDSNSEYQLSVVKQEYSFAPLGTAYTGNLSLVFGDNGDSANNSYVDLGLFMTPEAFAKFNEWSYRKNPTTGWYDPTWGTFSTFCDKLSKVKETGDTADTESGYYQIVNLINQYCNFKEEVEELYNLLSKSSRVMLNYTATDSDQPNLSWVIEITNLKKVEVEWNESTTVYVLLFQYIFIDEYCPTTTVTSSFREEGTSYNIELNLRQDLPQVVKINDLALQYFNTAQPSNFRFDLLADYNDSFVTAGVYENRLYLGGTDRNPNVIVASSRTYQDWLNFSTGSLAGDGLIENISSDYGVQLIKWLCGSSKLFIGTSDGVFIFGNNTLNDEAVTPANARAKQISSIPVGELQPLRGLDSVFFVDSSNKKIYEIVYDEQQYAVNELSLLARELYRSGIKSHAYMQLPQKLYWACMNDGTLVSMTYLKNINSLSASKQVLGTYTGDFQVISTSEGYNFKTVNNVPIKINNILSINKGDLNLVVMDVCRYLNGEVYSHTLEAFNYSLHKDPGNISRYYVDCGFELIHYANVTKITKGNTLQFTMSNSYETFRNLFEKADWIGVGSTDEEENTALQKINIDNFATKSQTVSQVSDNKIAIYKGINNGNLVSFSLDDIYINDLRSGYFWLGFSFVHGGQQSVYDLYQLNNASAYLRINYEAMSASLGSINFNINLNTYPGTLKVKIINSGLKNMAGESIDGIYDFKHLISNTYIPTDSYKQKLTINGHPQLGSECKIALAFPNDFTVSGFENGIFSMLTISTSEVPDRFHTGTATWHPCFLTDLPEISQINNKEIYLKYNSESNWDIAQLKNGEYEQISIPSNLTNISVRGYCYFPYNYEELQARLDMCSHLKNTKICLLTNHEYHYVTIEEDGVLNENDKEVLFPTTIDDDKEYTKEYWYLAGGFSYAARIKTTPFYNMSPIVGAGLGLINYQSEVVLQMYGCQTGYIGSDFERMSLIPYKRKPTDIVNEDFLMDPQVELVHCHTFPGKDIYQQSVCIVDINPVPLNILSITQDIEYSDQ